MRYSVAFLAALIAATVTIAALALQPPPPEGVNAPPAAFSAARAFPDIQAIAQRPHPTGSAEVARVRAYLAQRMAGLGLAPQLTAGPTPTLVGVLAGTDPSLPAIVLMAHADSVPTGPGAADDGAGVASALEVIRALKAAGPHRRDVMVLITDGEEAGLKGAKAFFGLSPLAAYAGIILNMEARGDRGRVVMFETHRQAGALIQTLARRGALRGASSLMPDLYRRLPNDTDLSVALRAGHQGLNFAFFDGQAAYHTALDTPARLQLGSVQHMGDQVLAIAAVLADSPALPPRSPDVVYADLLGGPVIVYPPAAGWLILAAAAGLGLAAALSTAQGRRARMAEIGQGAAIFLVAVLAVAAVLTFAGKAMMASGGGGREQFLQLLVAYPLVLAGCALLAGAVPLLVLTGWPRPPPAQAVALGALAVMGLVGAGLQAAAPFDAFIVAWPVLAAGVVVFAEGRSRPVWRAVAWLAALAGLAQVVYWAGLMFGLVGVATPGVLALFSALGVMLLAAWAAESGRSGLRLAAGGCLAGLGLLAYAAL